MLLVLPVKFIWTHDAFRVGEDGPTHEPVEQEAQVRLLEKLNNPSDGAETIRTFTPSLRRSSAPATSVETSEPEATRITSGFSSASAMI